MLIFFITEMYSGKNWFFEFYSNTITPPLSPAAPRFGARESNSSRKITQGAAERALAKTRKNGGKKTQYKSQ